MELEEAEFEQKLRQRNISDAVKEDLQGYILGYTYRQKVVHEVRAEYEKKVLEIQSENSCPLANEIATWRTNVGLCYPVFKARTSLHVGENPYLPSDQSDVCNPSPSLSPTSLSPSPSPSPAVFNTSPPSDWKEEEVEVFIKNLPNDRNTLLELKSKLGMELIWLKQAIVSRQKYLQLKKELETSPPNNSHPTQTQVV